MKVRSWNISCSSAGAGDLYIRSILMIDGFSCLKQIKSLKVTKNANSKIFTFLYSTNDSNHNQLIDYSCVFSIPWVFYNIVLIQMFLNEMFD